jgi:hypothetical protein
MQRRTCMRRQGNAATTSGADARHGHTLDSASNKSRFARLRIPVAVVPCGIIITPAYRPGVL